MALSLANSIIKYGEVDGTDRYNSWKAKVSASSKGRNTLDGFIRRYGKEEGSARYNSFKQKSLHNLETFTAKYGEVYGAVKYKEYCNAKTRNFANKVSYWTDRGYSDSEAREQVSSIQGNCTLDRFIERYGEEEGTTRYINKNKRYAFSVSLAGFIQRYGESGAQRFIAYNLSKSSSLEMCILRYGDDMGPQKYKEFVDKRKKSLSKESYEHRHGPGSFILKYVRNSGFYSQESIKFFIPIYKMLRRKGILRESIYWGIGRIGEYFLRHPEGIYFYDFTIPALKLVIEYHGVAWHPKIDSSPDWVSARGASKDEILVKDAHKRAVAEQNGFVVIEVWSDSLPRTADIFNTIEQLTTGSTSNLKSDYD